MIKTGISLVLDATNTGVSWFPQGHADDFNIAKGVVALIGVILLVVHMNQVFAHEALTLGRRLRYFALLAAAITITGGSVEQVQQGAVVNYRNLAGFAVAVLILASAVVSMHETRKENAR